MSISVSACKTFLSPVHFMNNSKLEKGHCYFFVIFAGFFFLKLGFVKMLIFHLVDHSKCPWIKHSRIRFYLSIVWYPFIILIQYLKYFQELIYRFKNTRVVKFTYMQTFPYIMTQLWKSPSIFLSKLNIIYRNHIELIIAFQRDM